jgi:hypothetical protein
MLAAGLALPGELVFEADLFAIDLGEGVLASARPMSLEVSHSAQAGGGPTSNEARVWVGVRGYIGRGGRSRSVARVGASSSTYAFGGGLKDGRELSLKSLHPSVGNTGKGVVGLHAHGILHLVELQPRHGSSQRSVTGTTEPTLHEVLVEEEDLDGDKHALARIGREEALQLLEHGSN